MQENSERTHYDIKIEIYKNSPSSVLIPPHHMAHPCTPAHISHFGLLECTKIY